jgi:hypothetical protein
VNAIAALVLFVKVTVCAGLVAPMRIGPKLSAVGVTTNVGIGVIFAMKASDVPFLVGWNAPAGKTGNFPPGAGAENVSPVTNALAGFAVSIAIA